MATELAAEIQNHPKIAAGENLVVGISGIDGSGKSTYAAHIARCLRDRDVTVEQIDLDYFLNPKRIRHADPDPGPGVLVVEGVFLFKKELRELFDVKVWLDVSFETAMERVTLRPRDQRYGNAEAIRERYSNRFFPTQRYHMHRDKPKMQADYVVTN